MFLRLLFLLYLIDAKIIENINFPSCKNCIHYKPTFGLDFNSDLNKCYYFGKKNIHTDENVYYYADMCRYDENKCGLSGKYFQQEQYIEFKILLHRIINTLPITLPLTMYLISYYMSL